MTNTTKEIRKTVIVPNTNVVKNILVPNGMGWQSTELQNKTVIESGQQKIMLKKIIELINSAQQTICLASFLIQDGELVNALLQATQRKVKVYVLSSADVRLKDSIEEEESFIKADYIKLLNEKFRNHFVHRSANNFHAKFIVVDGKTNAQAIISTNNFAEKGFTQNPELAVILNKQQAEELFKVFVYHFWEHTTDEQNATNVFEKVKPLGKFLLPNLQNVILTSPSSIQTIKERLLDAIKNAQSEISMSAYGFENTHEIARAVVDKLKSGVNITVFCRPREKATNELKLLAENGAEIFCQELLHAKMLLVDNKVGFIFTANYQTHGLETGFEVGVPLSPSQIEELKTIIGRWKDTFFFKFAEKREISTLSQYHTLSKEKPQSITVETEEKKEEIRKVDTVKGLITFFTQKNTPPQGNYMQKTQTYTAQIPIFEPTDEHHLTENKDTFAVYTFTEQKEVKKGKETEIQTIEKKMVVLYTKFNIDLDLEKIKQYNELPLFYQ